jgi:CzcA family heavy metal efflux pump
MIRSVVRSSLRFRLLVLGIAAAVMVLGVTQLRNAPVDVLPEFSPPYVEVQTEALGLSAEEVEQLVTVPLEADLLNGTAGVSVLRSESVPGESSITLLFEPGTRIMDARQLVQEQLTQAHANPNVSQPPQMLQPLSSQSRVMMIGLSPNKLSQIEASVLARWTIRPKLLGVPGVANVAIFGLRDRQLQVLVDPDRLRDENLTLNQVVRTAGNAQLVSPLSFLEASTPGTGGFIDTANQRLQIRHILPTVTPAKLARVPVEGAQKGGEAVRLGDITKVVEDHQPLIGDSILNSGTGLLLVVEKFPGANTLQVTRDVDAAMDELKPGLSGMQVDSHVFRPADFIEKAIDNLTLAVILGSVLLALLLFALLFEWRSALISFASFAVAMTSAALVMSVTDSTFNAVVFAGLAVAIGIVVGDSVMDVHNVCRRLRRRDEHSSASVAGIVIASAREIRGPIGYATLIILLAAVPVFFIEGVSGSFLEPLVRSYALAVLASMVVALTITPTLSSLLLSKPRRGGEPPLLRRPARRYGSALERVIAKPRLVIAAAAAALVVGVAVIPALSGPVIPSFKDRDFLVHLDGAPGTSRPEMARIVARASRELRSLPGVSSVGAHLGRAVTGDQVVDVNSSEIWVKANPGADYDATKASIENVVNGYPGFRHNVVTYEKQRLRDVAALDDKQADGPGANSADLDVLTGTDRRPLVVRVYGENQQVLEQQGARMKQLLSKVDGVVDPRVESQPQEPTMAIEVNLDKALGYGIKPGDVRRKAATLLQGIQVGNLFEQQKVFDVVVRATPKERRSLTDVRRLLLDTPSGGHVRVGDVASVRIRPTPTVIQRESSSRRIDVSANVSGRDLGAVRDDVKNRIRKLTFPLEYHAQVITDSTGQEATVKSLLGFGLAAAVGIFLLLQAAFRSWRLASLALVTLPIALLGCELAGLVDGGTFSLGSLAGLLAVFAIAARNGVLLVSHFQQLQQREGETFGPGLVLRGAGERFAPVFTIGAATAVAVLPFVVLGDRPGYEIVHPMAVAILGGLVTSTLLSLFIVPALYLRFGGAAAPEVSSEDDLLYRWAGAEPDMVEPASVGADGGAGMDTGSVNREEVTSSDDPAMGRSRQPEAASGVDHERQGE